MDDDTELDPDPDAGVVDLDVVDLDVAEVDSDIADLGAADLSTIVEARVSFLCRGYNYTLDPD